MAYWFIFGLYNNTILKGSEFIMASFFKTTEDNKVIFSGDGECIYYVPERFFSNNTATVVGEIVNVIGIFYYSVFDKAGKKVIAKTFNCPTMIQCKPYQIIKESGFQLEGTSKAMDYRLLYFHDGDELMCTTKIPEEFSNIELFVKLFTGGNLPESIPYDQIQDYILENANLNGFNYKVSNQIIGIVISELYRCKNDLSKPFRLGKMDDMLDYKAINIVDGPKYTSPFTAVTSDNADEAIAAAMTVAGNAESPLEKVVMG